jgi:site-specific recombinase XerD
VDRFDDWLITNRYTSSSRVSVIYTLPYVDADLRRRGIVEISSLSAAGLYACWRDFRKTAPWNARSIPALERFLTAAGIITADRGQIIATPGLQLSYEYLNHLREVRGFADHTISNHRRTTESFLQHLNAKSITVGCINASHIESYVAKAGKRMTRDSLQHEIGAIRGFLRFLSLDSRVPTGLDRQIDTPRLYRFEKLPRSLPWETVRKLLQSIDKTSPIGLRDYAMFLAIATYGLRSSEIVAISLEDIHWRQRILLIHQRKTSSPLELPLTNEVMSALVKHLKRTPPPAPHRKVFLRMHAPARPLTPTAVAETFCRLVRKSGLGLPDQRPHSLRHSYAVHLLKKGTSLKTIGDILGHRSAESTCMYLRLATEDLRDVALEVPGRATRKEEK